MKCLKQPLVIGSREDYQRSRRIKLKKEWSKSIRLKYDHKFGCKFWEKYLEKNAKGGV
jgi:hypothetical protein